jgi:hypothetical protein
MEFDIEKLAGFNGPGRPKSWYEKSIKVNEYHGTYTIKSPKAFNHKRFHPLLSHEETLRYLIEFLELDLNEIKMNEEHILTQNGHSMIQELFKLRRFFRELLVFPVGSCFRINFTGISQEWMNKIIKRTGWLEKCQITIAYPRADIFNRSRQSEKQDAWRSTNSILTKCDWDVRKLIHTELSLKFKLPKDICNLICQQLGYPITQ